MSLIFSQCWLLYTLFNVY